MFNPLFFFIALCQRGEEREKRNGIERKGVSLSIIDLLGRGEKRLRLRCPSSLGEVRGPKRKGEKRGRESALDMLSARGEGKGGT